MAQFTLNDWLNGKMTSISQATEAAKAHITDLQNRGVLPQPKAAHLPPPSAMPPPNTPPPTQATSGNMFSRGWDVAKSYLRNRGAIPPPTSGTPPTTTPPVPTTTRHLVGGVLSGIGGRLANEYLTPYTEGGGESRENIAKAASAVGTVGAQFLPGWWKTLAAVPEITRGLMAKYGYAAGGGRSFKTIDEERKKSEAAWANANKTRQSMLAQPKDTQTDVGGNTDIDEEPTAPAASPTPTPAIPSYPVAKQDYTNEPIYSAPPGGYAGYGTKLPSENYNGKKSSLPALDQSPIDRMYNDREVATMPGEGIVKFNNNQIDLSYTPEQQKQIKADIAERDARYAAMPSIYETDNRSDSQRAFDAGKAQSEYLRGLSGNNGAPDIGTLFNASKIANIANKQSEARYHDIMGQTALGDLGIKRDENVMKREEHPLTLSSKREDISSKRAETEGKRQEIKHKDMKFDTEMKILGLNAKKIRAEIAKMAKETSIMQDKEGASHERLYTSMFNKGVDIAKANSIENPEDVASFAHTIAQKGIELLNNPTGPDVKKPKYVFDKNHNIVRAQEQK